MEVVMFNHIISNPAILGGKPCIKGTRLSVEFILELFASGATREEILMTYPQLQADAIEESLRYAARSVKNEIILTTGCTNTFYYRRRTEGSSVKIRVRQL
jgi:uncharacterized protein (DUF433 family)